jgi:flagellar hook assembly protein FlgD
VVTPSGIEDDVDVLPTEFGLSQNYPNPFNATTKIEFGLPVKSDVRLEIYNVLGQKVATVVDGEMDAGFHSVIWDGTDQSGAEAATGLYLFKMVAGEQTFVKKMLMLK